MEGGHDARTGGRGGRRAAGAPGADPGDPLVKFGPDMGVNAGNWDFAVVAEFDSIDHQIIYRDRPEHQRVITELIAPIRADRASVQYDAG
jgi:hypothetical protein